MPASNALSFVPVAFCDVTHWRCEIACLSRRERDFVSALAYVRDASTSTLSHTHTHNTRLVKTLYLPAVHAVQSFPEGPLVYPGIHWHWLSLVLFEGEIICVGHNTQDVCPDNLLYDPAGHSAHSRARLRMALLSASAITNTSLSSSKSAGALNFIGGELHSQLFPAPGAGSKPNESAEHMRPIIPPLRVVGDLNVHRSPAEVP